MATTYTSRIRLAKQGLGDNTDTWGTVQSEQDFDMTDEAWGLSTIDASGGGSITLTTVNGATDQARSFALKLNGSPAAGFTIVLPNIDKPYIIHNISGQTATIQTATPTQAQTIISGDMDVMYCDGAASVFKIGSITASSVEVFTNKTFDANGTGNSITNIDIADLSNGTAGELITWSSGGGPTTVPTGISGDVLTSNGAGTQPTFQTPSSGGGTNRLTGEIIPYAGSTEPSGWVFCAAQPLSRTTFADLFAVIGTTYGIGDGSTTFNTPDLRGRLPVGRDDMGGSATSRITTAGSGINGIALGSAGGSQSHTLVDAEMPAHTHNGAGLSAASGGAHTHNVTLNSSGTTGHFVGNSDSAPDTINATSSAGTHTHAISGTTGSAGSGGAHRNVQPSLVINYLIKT